MPSVLSTSQPRPVNNIFLFFSEGKQGPGLATNHATNPLVFAGKIEKFLAEPIRLHDLQNSARSRTEKKTNKCILVEVKSFLFNFIKSTKTYGKSKSKIHYYSVAVTPLMEIPVEIK